MQDCTAESEYFLMRSRDLRFENLRMKGKYSFQYIEHAVFENCVLDTKDAFWHAKHVLVQQLRGQGRIPRLVLRGQSRLKTAASRARSPCATARPAPDRLRDAGRGPGL